MLQEWCECFPRNRGLAIPTYITALSGRKCRDACRDRQLGVSFVVGGRESAPGIPQFYVSGKRPMVQGYSLISSPENVTVAVAYMPADYTRFLDRLCIETGTQLKWI